MYRTRFCNKYLKNKTDEKVYKGIKQKSNEIELYKSTKLMCPTTKKIKERILE